MISNSSPPDILQGISYIEKNDVVLRKIISNVGQCDLKPKVDLFKGLVRIIIGQQVSYYAAKAIFSRFESALKSKISPENLVSMQTSDLCFYGLSQSKARTILVLARHVIDKKIDLESLCNSSYETIFEQLTKIKGIGPWTVCNYMIFVLSRLDVLPIHDLAFRRAIKINYNLQDNPTDDEIIQISKRWGNYKTIASWYLWETINRKMIK